jgi:hypothetical protein
MTAQAIPEALGDVALHLRAEHELRLQFLHAASTSR